AMAQIRHCCHPGTMVLIEGDWDPNLPAGGCYFSTEVPTTKFTPSLGALDELLSAAYFRVTNQAPLSEEEAPPAGSRQAAEPGRLGWRWRLRMCWQALRGTRAGVKKLADVLQPSTPAAQPFKRDFRRVFLVCTPFIGKNAKHRYAPPFGLHQYDTR